VLPTGIPAAFPGNGRGVEDLTLVIDLIDGALTRSTNGRLVPVDVDALLDLRIAVQELMELAQLEAML
jgi:hypothetical protein